MDNDDEMGRNLRIVAILVEMFLWCGNVFPSFLGGIVLVVEALERGEDNNNNNNNNNKNMPLKPSRWWSIYSLCSFRFELCSYSYDGHWRLTWSLTSGLVGLVEVRVS